VGAFSTRIGQWASKEPTSIQDSVLFQSHGVLGTLAELQVWQSHKSKGKGLLNAYDE
jgi:hypothetical protein